MSSYDIFLKHEMGCTTAIRDQSPGFVETICENDRSGMLYRHGVENFWITDRKNLILGQPPASWKFGHADTES